MLVESKPYLSVVIPFYDGLDKLELALAGLSRQTLPLHDFEVIVAEDGSVVCPREMASDFGALRTRHIRIERDGYRLSTARNQAIIVAQRLIVLLDFDCIPLPNHLAEHVALLNGGSNVATVGIRRFIDGKQLRRSVVESGEPWWLGLDDVSSISNYGNSIDKRVSEIGRISEHPFPCNLFHGCNVGFWRQTAIDVGLFDEQFNGAPGYEDIEFAYRLQRRGAKFRATRSPAFHIENTIVGEAARELGRTRNFRLLSELCPDLVAYRLLSDTAASLRSVP